MSDSDGSRGSSPTGRRQSFTERMFGNAKDWFQSSRSISNPGTQLGTSAPNNNSRDAGGDGGDGQGRRTRSQSLSTSYMFNHHRDLIIPGPVF